MEEKQRSIFAQALYDLMITPGIYPIEEWCVYINPWVQKDNASTFGDEAYGAPKTIALIQSWFNDTALPDQTHLQTIITICETGNVGVFLASIDQGVGRPDLEAYKERYKKGYKIQEEALNKFFEVLDQKIDDVSPLRNKLPVVQIFLHKIGDQLLGFNMHNLFRSLLELPVRHRFSVLVKVDEVIRAAEKNNWYSKPE